MNFASTYPSGDPWYVVRCKPGRETYVANVLQKSLGLFVFLPEIAIRQRGEVRHLPFFPGYLFVQVDLQMAPFRRINKTHGVLQVVAFGGDPTPVSSSILEAISTKVDLLNTGNHLPSYNFSPGDLVRLKNGPLYDLEMVFVRPITRNERVQVLLHFLGHMREIKVDPGKLEKIADAASYDK